MITFYKVKNFPEALGNYFKLSEALEDNRGLSQKDVEALVESLKDSMKVKDAVRDKERVKLAEMLERLFDSSSDFYLSDTIKNSISDLVLSNHLEGNTSPDKMTNEEYPLLTRTQYERRTGQRGVRSYYEVSSIWLENVGTNGKSYLLPTAKR